MRRRIYQNRTYRNLIPEREGFSCNVVVKETDLHIRSDKPIEDKVKTLILRYRGQIETHIEQYPEFLTSLTPLSNRPIAPPIILDMLEASRKAGVGPMAAVAGAISEYVGRDLLEYASEVIVENGGDIFMKARNPLTVGIFAGNSPLSLRIGIKTPGGDVPMAVCTSSGTVGHSLSMGTSDAVCVTAASCPLADAAATAIGNHVGSGRDIRDAVAFGRRIEGITGLVIVRNDKTAIWGDLEVTPLTGKKGLSFAAKKSKC